MPIPFDVAATNFPFVRTANKYNSSKTSVEEIMGMPPAAYHNSDYKSIILNSMPVLELTPGYPQYRKAGSTGLKLYSFDKVEGDRKFADILNNLGLPVPVTPMKFAFQYEAPFTESFSNEFSESMFEEIGNFKIPFIQEAKYITGASSTSQAIKDLSKVFGSDPITIQAGLDKLKAEGPLDRTLTSVAEFLAKGLTGVASAGVGAAENFVKSSFPKHGAQILKLLEGSNIDFPKIWQTSIYSPSYSVSIKLTNPNPMSDVSYNEHVIYPLIYLLSFVTPISDSESTFTFPLLSKVNCPGLFKIDSGYVQSLDVTKGGESGDIAFKQRPGTIEVRLTFAEMYNTMISTNKKYIGDQDQDRPTLVKYIDNLRSVSTPPEWGLDNNVTSIDNTTNISDVVPDTLYIPQTLITDPKTLRVSSDDNSTYTTLNNKNKNTVSEQSGDTPKPLITDINPKTIKKYETAASNENKDGLQIQAQNESNPLGQATDTDNNTKTRTQVFLERSKDLANEAISKTPEYAYKGIDYTKAGIDKARQAVENVYNSWKSSEVKDDSTVPDPEDQVFTD